MYNMCGYVLHMAICHPVPGGTCAQVPCLLLRPVGGKLLMHGYIKCRPNTYAVVLVSYILSQIASKITMRSVVATDAREEYIVGCNP